MEVFTVGDEESMVFWDMGLEATIFCHNLTKNLKIVKIKESVL